MVGILKKLLFFGELPPQVLHGISISNRRILDALSTSICVGIVEDTSSFGSFFNKMLSSVKAFILVFIKAFLKFDIFYVNAPMSRYGLLKIFFLIKVVTLISPSTAVVAHLHRGDARLFTRDKIDYKLLHLFCDNLRYLVVLSNQSANEIVELGLLGKDKIYVLHNTVLLEKASCYERVWSAGNLGLYCLCNYIESKRIESLVRISQNLNVKIDFNGTISSNCYMKKLYSLNVNELCFFHGTISGEEKMRTLRSAKALILPSLNEGMPLVILESLALGTPVICFDIGYISEYLGEDYPGLVSALNNEAMERKITWLNCLSEREYQSLRKQSFELFWKNYSPEKIDKQVLTFFHSINN
jgi:glycosyltransferase involved in cell wall biosynthesis